MKMVTTRLLTDVFFLSFQPREGRGLLVDSLKISSKDPLT